MSLRSRVIVKSRGRITIPEELQKKHNIKEGTVLELQSYGKDKILIIVLVR